MLLQIDNEELVYLHLLLITTLPNYLEYKENRSSKDSVGLAHLGQVGMFSFIDPLVQISGTQLKFLRAKLAGMYRI